MKGLAIITSFLLAAGSLLILQSALPENDPVVNFIWLLGFAAGAMTAGLIKSCPKKTE